MEDDFLGAGGEVVFEGAVRVGFDGDLVLVEEAEPEDFFGLFVGVYLVLEYVIQLFEVELLFEDFK